MEKPDLPGPVAAYFAADRRTAIARWKDEASRRYGYVSEPLSCLGTAGGALVSVRLTGRFPGSPVVLRYSFEFAGTRIASLEIAP